MGYHQVKKPNFHKKNRIAHPNKRLPQSANTIIYAPDVRETKLSMKILIYTGTIFFFLNTIYNKSKK